MIDQSLVTSGFDVEILMGGRYLRNLLLSSVETGTIPLDIAVVDPANGIDLQITLRPPEDYERRYEPHPVAPPFASAVADAFDTLVLAGEEDDLLVRFRADIVDNNSGAALPNQFIDLFVSLDLVTEMNEDGGIVDASLRFEVMSLNLDPQLLSILTFLGQSPADLLPLVKAEIDREVDFGLVDSGQAVQSIEMRKHGSATGVDRALGVYVNLRLRNGTAEDDFLGDRGDIDNSQNFLPSGEDLAFGLPGGAFAALADDIAMRMTEESLPGSGLFRIPIREDQSDPDSDVVGVIDTIGLAGGLNTLVVTITGEFFVDHLPDPDFTLRLTFTPEIVDGELSFAITHDVDLNLIGDLFVHLLIGFIVSPALGLFGALLLFGLQELVAEPLANQAIGDQLDSFGDASFLDAFPTRITVEQRRWDPFYVTEHQILTLLDELQITPLGIGFSGVSVLDKQVRPVRHVVIRNEQRNANDVVEALDYRVNDHERFTDDFAAIFPGTDREPSAAVIGDVETDLFRLTMGQATVRAATDKLQPRISYVAKNIDLRDNQVHRLLCVSTREEREERNRVRGEFIEAAKAAVLADQGDQLTDEVRDELEAELGMAPTDEQVEAALDARLDDIIADDLSDFEEDELPELADAAIDAILRFDLDAPELLALEDANLLFLDGAWQRVNGPTSRYYRDKPDGDESDNLHQLPSYVSLL